MQKLIVLLHCSSIDHEIEGSSSASLAAPAHYLNLMRLISLPIALFIVRPCLELTLPSVQRRPTTNPRNAQADQSTPELGRKYHSHGRRGSRREDGR